MRFDTIVIKQLKFCHIFDAGRGEGSVGAGPHPAVLRAYSKFCAQELLLMVLKGPNRNWLSVKQVPKCEASNCCTISPALLSDF